MSTAKIEIVLTHVNENKVDLENMSKEALISFLAVAESFKNIAESFLPVEATYSIKKGSASFGVYSSHNNISQIVNLMGEAIDGNSTDQIMTDNMRRIQKEIQKPSLSFELLYNKQNFAPKIKSAKKITKKRVAKIFDYKLEILTGFFNQIGGNEPNYHFSNSKNEDKISIGCTIEDARELKNCLYENISTVVIRKIDRTEDKPTFTHCTVLHSKDKTKLYRIFLNKYNTTQDILERLDYMYEFIYNSDSRKDDILFFLKLFNNKVFNINEIKTVLIISKNIAQSDSKIKEHRDKLLFLFNELIEKMN